MLSKVNRRKKQLTRHKYILDMKSNIVCPFLKDMTLYSVACLSIIKEARSYTKFSTKEDFIKFQSKYCANIENYNKCPIYCIHNKFIDMARKKARMAKLEQIPISKD